MSKINVNTVDTQCGSTLTLGSSGKTVTLASGASQSGFGRSGSVDWQTTPKTATFTATDGEGYFCNTSGGAFTVNLPAGSAGAIVAIADYTRTFATNNLTIAPNGSEKIGGVAETVILDINGQALTLVYVDATEGWINVQNAEDTETGLAAAFVTATGGNTVATCGNFKIHTFTGDGTFTVSCAGNPKGSDKVDYLVIAGGGAGGGNDHGGGGGAGGYRFSDGTSSGCYSAGPAPLGASALPVSAQAYPITVGGGGTAGSFPTGWRGNNGDNSVFSTITSAGGGGGASNGPGGPGPVARNGLPGGSGGGGAGISGQPNGTGGTGNTPPVSPPQGNNGGDGNYSGGSPAGYPTGGGGGAGAAGGAGSGPASGNGGNGLASSITTSPVTRGGGGGGSSYPSGTNGTGGTGGGGAGVTNTTTNPGTANTGGGGGGLSQDGCVPGGLGGSGIVVIRYKFQ